MFVDGEERTAEKGNLSKSGKGGQKVRRIRRKWFYGQRNQVPCSPVGSGTRLLVLLSLSLLSSLGFKGPIGTPPRQCPRKLLYRVKTISSSLAKPFNLFVIALPSSYQTMSLLLWSACLWVSLHLSSSRDVSIWPTVRKGWKRTRGEGGCHWLEHISFSS